MKQDGANSGGVQRPSPAVAAARERLEGSGRDRILRSALECFAEHGFGGATNRMIAARAGVTAPLLLYHFSTKTSLWLETVRWALRDYIAGVERLVEQTRNTDARVGLEAFITHFVRFSSECPEIHRIMAMQGQNETQLKTVIDDFVRPVFTAIRTLIRRGQAEGSVRDGDSARIYYQIISAGTIFSIAREYQELTGRDAFEQSEILHTIAHTMKAVFQDQGSGPARSST